MAGWTGGVVVVSMAGGHNQVVSTDHGFVKRGLVGGRTGLKQRRGCCREQGASVVLSRRGGRGW